MMKNKIYKTKLIYLLSVFLICTLSISKITTKAYDLKGLVFDFNSGQIYKSVGDIDEQVKVASVSKILTHYVLLEKIAKKEIDPNKEVTISREISEYSVAPMLSNVPLDSKQTYKFDDLLKASMIVSANAATTALAIDVSGSELDFLKLCDQKAQELGLKNYRLVNTTGLSNDLVPEGLKNKTVEMTAENEFSARDLGILTRALYKNIDIPQISYYEIAELDFVTNPSFQNKFLNTNKMLQGGLYYYPGVKGTKTGTSLTAGANFIAKANINENLMQISIVLNANDDEDRYRKTEEFLNFKIRNQPYETIIIDPEKSSYEEIPIKRSYQTSTKGYYKDQVKALIINDEDFKKISYQFVSFDNQSYVKGNYAKDQQIGYVKITIPNINFLTVQDQDQYKVNIYTANAIEEKNVMNNLSDAINAFFAKLFR